MGKVIEAFRHFTCWECFERRPADHFLFEGVAEAHSHVESIRAFTCWLCRRNTLREYLRVAYRGTVGTSFLDDHRYSKKYWYVDCSRCKEHVQLVHFASARPSLEGKSWCARCYRHYRQETGKPIRYPPFFYTRDPYVVRRLALYVSRGAFRDGIPFGEFDEGARYSSMW